MFHVAYIYFLNENELLDLVIFCDIIRDTCFFLQVDFPLVWIDT